MPDAPLPHPFLFVGAQVRLASSTAHPKLATHLRTHTCGDLSASHVDQQVKLCGWAQNIRVLSDTLVFVQLRDAYGSIQLLAEQSKANDFAKQKRVLEQLSPDTLIGVQGTIVRRPEATVKQDGAGEIELLVDNIEVLNHTESLPFNPYIKEKL
ncbi:aspartate--tRNA ligase msd1, partial [Linderina macrospora]